MANKSDENDVDVAVHDGDIRIYEIQEIKNWIQSDTSVQEYLDDNDAKPVAGVLTEIENEMPENDGDDE